MADADDKESVDRAFAELVAGYHLTADRPAPEPDPPPDPGWEPPPAGAVFIPPLPLPEPKSESAPEEGYDPGPPPPLPKPAWPALIGWLGLGYAVLTVLAVAVGIRLPAWAAWAGVVGFVGGFGLLVSRLPRHRPPDAGDGAVL